MGPTEPRPRVGTRSPCPTPRLEYEARNQKKEAKELAFLEAVRRQAAPPERESDCDA